MQLWQVLGDCIGRFSADVFVIGYVDYDVYVRSCCMFMCMCVSVFCHVCCVHRYIRCINIRLERKHYQRPRIGGANPTLHVVGRVSTTAKHSRLKACPNCVV